MVLRDDLVAEPVRNRVSMRCWFFGSRPLPWASFSSIAVE
jgi:hypothetical protein